MIESAVFVRKLDSLYKLKMNSLERVYSRLVKESTEMESNLQNTNTILTETRAFSNYLDSLGIILKDTTTTPMQSPHQPQRYDTVPKEEIKQATAVNFSPQKNEITQNLSDKFDQAGAGSGAG